MAWFKKAQYTLLRAPQTRDRIPDGLWAKCAKCGGIVLTRDFAENLGVCPKCNHHTRIPAKDRIRQIMDPGTFVETNAGMTSADPLKFVDVRPYPEQIARYQKKTGLREAVVTGHGKIKGLDVSVGFMDPNFIMGSMGSVVGEKVSRAFEYSMEHGVPAVMFCATGGARMQEGLLSLMQMAKTSAVVGRLHQAEIPYMSVLTDPTGAGVAASFAMLGDLIISEPGAEIYFTGSRVIEQTIREVLPKGFQRAEFMVQHGFIDMIVQRRELRDTLADLLAMLTHHQVARESDAPEAVAVANSRRSK